MIQQVGSNTYNTAQQRQNRVTGPVAESRGLIPYIGGTPDTDKQHASNDKEWKYKTKCESERATTRMTVADYEEQQPHKKKQQHGTTDTGDEVHPDKCDIRTSSPQYVDYINAQGLQAATASTLLQGPGTQEVDMKLQEPCRLYSPSTVETTKSTDHSSW